MRLRLAKIVVSKIKYRSRDQKGSCAGGDYGIYIDLVRMVEKSAYEIFICSIDDTSYCRLFR